jgi:hypothetical protein
MIRCARHLLHPTTAHAELGGDGHSSSAQKVTAIIFEFFGHISPISEIANP